MNGNDNVLDKKLVYQLILSRRSLGLINPSLFVEKLTDELFLKLPSIKVEITHTKSAKQTVQLKCFCSSNVPDYKILTLREDISFIASTLRDELLNRIEDAKRSVA